MYVEKRIGGDYYQYVISITTYNPEQAAIRTLKWYVNYLNQRLFQSCYSYELTHGECFLIIHLKESEYKDTEVYFCRPGRKQLTVYVKISKCWPAESFPWKFSRK